MKELLSKVRNPVVICKGGRRSESSVVDKAVRRWVGKWVGIGGTYVVVHTDVDRYGKDAEDVRMEEMLEQAQALIAFWDGDKDNETYEWITAARQEGLKVKIVRV